MCGRGERVCNGVSFACTPSSCGEKGRESLTWDSERTRPKHTPSCRTLKQLPSICHDLDSSGCNQDPLRTAPSNDDPLECLGPAVKTCGFRTISGYTGSSKDPELSVWMVPEWLSSRPYFFR